MAQLNLTRNGTFRAEDVGAVESKLRAVPENLPVSGYLSGTNMLFIFSNGLTAPQQTAAQAIINAHVAITDQAQLSNQQKALVAYLKISGNPTAAQNLVAMRTMARMILAMTFRTGTVDGVDTTL